MSNSKGYIIGNQYSCYFLTFTIVGWVDLFSRKECRDIIIESLKYCKKNKGLNVHAYVVMTNHIHLVLSAEENSAGLSNIIRDLKTYTAKALLKWIVGSRKESRRNWLKVAFAYHAKFNSNNSKYQVWQQNNRPKECIHPKFTNQKINYIHNNPVVDGIVDRAEDYCYSSARSYLAMEGCLLEVDVIDFGCEEGYLGF